MKTKTMLLANSVDGIWPTDAPDGWWVLCVANGSNFGAQAFKTRALALSERQKMPVILQAALVNKGEPLPSSKWNILHPIMMAAYECAAADT